MHRGAVIAVYQEPVAPNITARHSLRCARTATAPKRRCTCEPAYRARVFRSGESTTRTFPTLTLALKFVDETQRSTPAERPGRRRLSFRDAAARFLTEATEGRALTRSWRAYRPATITGLRHALDRLDPHIGDQWLHTLDRRAMQTAISAIAVQSQSGARVSAAALTAVLRHAFEQGWTDDAPPVLRLPPPGPGRDRVLTAAELARLLAAAIEIDSERGRSFLHPLLVLLAGSGLRISEALGIDAADLDLDGEPPALRVRESKTDAGVRRVPLAAADAEVLRRHVAGRSGPVFVRRDGARAERAGGVRSGLADACARAGLVGVTPHVLRHTHATLLASAGVAPNVLAARLGHTDAAFTMRRYAHARQVDADAVATLLDRL